MYFEQVLRALQAAGVRFIVVGGLAVILHGVPRTTADLDVVTDLDEENLRRLVEVMTRLGFRPRAPVPATDLLDPVQRQSWIDEKGLKAFTFVQPGRPLEDVDILIDAPLGYAHLAANAETLTAEGLSLRIAAIPDLIVMKLSADRDQDRADVDALRRLQEARRGG